MREAKHTDWLRTFDVANDVERRRVMDRELNTTDPEGRCHMGEVARKVSIAAGIDPILVTDVGLNQMLSSRYFRYTAPARSSPPAASAQWASASPPPLVPRWAPRPDRVCVFAGDGGIQMTIQELGTIMQYGVNVKIIVLNNDYLGNVRQWQALFYDNRYSQTPMVNPDFVMIARAYGIEAEDVERRADLNGAIERMMATDGPYLPQCDGR